MTRTEFAATVAHAAGAVATVLADHPLRAERPYPLADVLAELVRQHEVLREAVDTFPEPPGLDPLGADVAALMSYLQLLRVLYLRLDDLPADLRVAASRYLAAAHLTARRTRDRARRSPHA